MLDMMSDWSAYLGALVALLLLFQHRWTTDILFWVLKLKKSTVLFKILNFLTVGLLFVTNLISLATILEMQYLPLLTDTIPGKSSSSYLLALVSFFLTYLNETLTARVLSVKKFKESTELRFDKFLAVRLLWFVTGYAILVVSFLV